MRNPGKGSGYIPPKKKTPTSSSGIKNKLFPGQQAAVDKITNKPFPGQAAAVNKIKNKPLPGTPSAIAALKHNPYPGQGGTTATDVAAAGYGARGSAGAGTSVTDVAPAGGGARGGAGGGSSGGAGASPTDPKTKTLAKKNGNPFGALGALGGSIGTMLDPSLAGSIAGGTYDPVINDFQNQLAMLPGQTKQNKADITNWMNQVLGSLATGQKRSDKGYDTATSAAGDTANGIIASLGGSDNPGGRMVGESGANAASMMQALKGNNDAFLNDMQPILQLEKSGQLNAQDATASSLSRDLMSQLASAQGQKSGLDAQTQMQITQMNNALAQQRFGNMFGVDQASIASQVANGNNKLTSAYKAAQIAKILAGLQNPAPARGSFGATTASDRLSMAQKINSAITQLKGQNPNIGVAPVMQQINSLIGSAGWNIADPGVAAWRNSLLPGIGINPTTQAWNG